LLDYKFEHLRTIHTGIVAVAEWYNFRNPTVLGLTANAVREEVRGLAQSDIHFVPGCMEASEERQDGQRVRAIEERDAVERTVQQAMAPAELAGFRPAIRRIRIADEVAAAVEQRRERAMLGHQGERPGDDRHWRQSSPTGDPRAGVAPRANVVARGAGAVTAAAAAGVSGRLVVICRPRRAGVGIRSYARAARGQRRR